MFIHDPEVVKECAKRYTYFAHIAFNNSIKAASRRWHSLMLDDTPAVKTRGKVNSGIKMYCAEVLGKLPVIQHFLFSSLLLYNGPAPPASNDSQQDDPYRGHGHAHGDLDGARAK